MMKLVDGPAKGTYMCKRAPLYLRAVVNDKGGTDALDMPSDTPTELEAIHVYRRIGGHSMVHLNMADWRMSGFYARADYEWMPDVCTPPFFGNVFEVLDSGMKRTTAARALEGRK